MDTTNTNPTPLPPDEELVEARKPASLLVAQFFLFPLIIIGICVGIFLFFGYLTYEQRTPTQYLSDIRSGNGNQRWQAAYELSVLVRSNPEKARTPEFVESLMTAYRESPDEDIRVRSHLALMLGEMKDRSAVPLLVEGIAREENLKSADWSKKGWIQILRPSLDEITDDLIRSQLSGLWALRTIGDNSAVPGVLEQVKNQNSTVRSVAAYVAGELGDPRAIEPLRVLLNDPKEDVRSNAALALAQLGDNEGADLLMKFLDHGYVDGLMDFDPEQKTELTVNAIIALSKLKYAPAFEQIRVLSQNDPNLAVRGAALDALKKF